MSNKEIEIDVQVRAKTEKSWLCYNGSIEVWVPISQITDYVEENDGSISSIFLNEWQAKDKGLI